MVDNGNPAIGSVSITNVYSSGSASNSELSYSNEAEVVLENGLYKVQLKDSKKTTKLSTSNYTILNNLKGYYFYKNIDGFPKMDVVYYYPVDAGDVHLRSSYVEMPNAQIVRVKTEFGDWEYFQSSDRSVCPDSGEQDGYEYQYLGIPFDNAVTAPKIATGSYVGTGKYGSSNPNSLTLGFEPKFVFVAKYYGYSAGYGQWMDCFMWITGVTGIPINNTSDCVFSSNNNSLSWYSTSSANEQLNENNTEYVYYAIG